MKTTAYQRFMLCIALSGATLSTSQAGITEKAASASTNTTPPLETKKKRTTSFFLAYENDIFAGTDQFYTSGGRIGLTTRDYRSDELTGWHEKASRFTLNPQWENTSHAFGVSLTQLMFTPNNITIAEPLPKNHPYAGWLNIGFSVQTKTPRALELIELNLGVTGPLSFTEEAQTFIHENIVSSPTPKGWDNQLRSEPTINLFYERIWRHHYPIGSSAFSYDILPRFGASFGNVFTNLEGGFVARIGYHLPDDFGFDRVRNTTYVKRAPSGSLSKKVSPWSIHTFLGGETHFYIRDLFIDGNTAGYRPPIDKRPVRFYAMVGGAICYKQWKLVYTHTFESRKFDQQDDAQYFGTVTLAHLF